MRAHLAGVELDALRTLLGELEETNQRLAQKVTNQRAQLLKKTRQMQKAQRGSRAPDDVGPTGPLFLDAEEQLRFEVGVEWAQRIAPGDKADRMLATYTIGPQFLTSLDDVEGIDRHKVVQVIVEVLTDLAKDLDGRDLHPLYAAARPATARQ